MLNDMYTLCMTLCIAFNCSQPLPPTAAQGLPLHSHNDYWRRAPLLEALEAGCISIEADVFAGDGKLMVAHDRKKIRKENTLTAMYLEPLAMIVRDRGRIYPRDPRPVILMIDIKSSWDETHPVLSEVLKPFHDVIHAPGGTYTGDGGIIIATSGAGSGQKRIANGISAVDGRPNDFGKGISHKKMPVVSLSYRSYFSWSIKEPLPEDQLQKLKSLAQKSREEGKLLRLWGAPDVPATWDLLLTHGVGLINTDQPKTAAKHVSAYIKNKSSHSEEDTSP